MLTLPEVLTHKGIVVYPDDEDPNLMYCLQGVPQLLQIQGAPVFRAVFWTDDATGGGGAVAGLRGALLNFDVDLAIADNVLAEIRSLIEESGIREQRQRIMARAERERLERLARARGEAFDPARVQMPEIRPVRFGSLRIREGKAVLLQESGGGLVEWASAGGPPSLIGNNNAAFALRLGAEGAAVWHGALTQNAAAIGVRMDVKFEARLPSLQIHVWAGSSQSFELDRVAQRIVENHDQGCSDRDVERINTYEITQSLQEEGLIHIEVIKGQARISDEHVSQLRNLAIELMSERVREILKSRLKGITDDERRNSLIRMIREQVNAFAELRLTQRDVIEWPASPQATITDFFRGLNASERGSFMTVVDLSKPVVSTLEVPVTVVADWDAEPRLSHVKVTVEYHAASHEPVKERLLDKSQPSQTLFWRRSRQGNKRLHYSAEAFVVGNAEPIRLPDGRSNGAIVVTVPHLGRFKATLKPHPDTFGVRGSGQISAVQVDYRYKSESASDHRSGSVVLRGEQVDDGLELMETTFREIDAPLLVKTTFFRPGAPAIEVPGEQELWMHAGEGQIQLPTPWPDTIRVSVRVPPNIPGLEQVVVELEHQDPSTDFASDAKLLLDDDIEWEGTTTLVQRRQEAQQFRYRYTVVGQEQLSRGPWLEAEGDQTLILSVLSVRLRTELLGLGQAFSIAIVKLRYHDAARDFETSHEFFLTPETPAPVWLVPRVDPNHDRYHMSMVLIRADDGSEVTVPESEMSGANLLLWPPV